MTNSNNLFSNLKKLQQMELDILKEFINICNKENLQYYVLGGTMLGAIRHKGFIPWDDDIDVGMPRKDYEKFLIVAQKYLPKQYFLQTYITDREYPLNFAKIRNSNTTFIQSSFNQCNMNHGIYIDVFVLDYYSTNKIKNFLFSLQNRIFLFRVNDIYDLSKAPYSLYKKFCIKCLAKILKLIYPNINIVLQKRDNMLKSVKETTFLANHNGAWGKKEIVPSEWYGKGIDMPFETLIVKVPEYYDKWLTQVYGNYMQLPPKEKQISHHYTDIIDLENPYTKYMKRDK